MSFIQFFRILWARRAIILTGTLACFAAGLLVIQLVPARYTGNSRVMLEIVKPDPVTGEVISSQFARAYVKTQIELIRDYRVAGKVADSFGWTNSPILLAQYNARSSNDTSDFRRWLAQRVIDNTDAGLIEGSNILEISYSSANPEVAADVADALRQAYSDQMLSSRRDTAARNASWFKEQTEKVKGQLTEAEKQKSDFERANGVLLQDNNVDTESARLQALAASAPAAPMVTQAVAAPVSSPSMAQLGQIDAAIAAAQQTLGPNHPDLQSMRQQRAAVAASASREMAAARTGSGGGAASGPSIGALYNAQTAKVLAQRGKVDEARQLAVRVTVLRDQLNKTAARAADLDQQAESTETGLTFLGSAVAPQSAEFPNVPLITFGSLAFGLFLGILVAMIIELLSRRVRGVEDLEIPGIPLIGVMGRMIEPRRGRVFGLLPAPKMASGPT